MTTPRALLSAWNIYAKKQLGQNFLTDPATADMIVRRSGISAEDVVIEIGAGLGALTIPASRHSRKIYALEKDRQLVPILKTELVANRAENVQIMECDALAMDYMEIFDNEGRQVVVMGNLPYNISSQVLVRLIHSRRAVDRAVLMFQKELARRMTAPPGIKDYGRLSVMLQYCAQVTEIARIKANQFFPKPKVDSVVLMIKFHPSPLYLVENEPFFFKVVQAAFGQRRKTLKNALSGSMPNCDRAYIEEVLIQTDISPNRRAETLSVQDFVHLSNQMWQDRHDSSS